MNSRFFAVLAVMLVVGCGKNSPVSPVQKPDLTFGQVAYTRFVGLGSGPLFRFTIHVRNIGTADFCESFYISNSRSASDYNEQYCSHTSIVNYPPVKLFVGDSIEVTFADAVDDSVPQVLFVINTNDRYNRGVPLPTIDELSYENNSASLVMQW